MNAICAADVLREGLCLSYLYIPSIESSTVLDVGIKEMFLVGMFEKYINEFI